MYELVHMLAKYVLLADARISPALHPALFTLFQTQLFFG